MILNETEGMIIKMMAQSRIAHNRKHNYKDTLYLDKDPTLAEINYLGAEFAFCKQFNIYPDLDHLQPKEYDCIFNGYTVDVKHTERPHGRLIVKNKKWTKIPDYFVLMIGTFPEYQYAGNFKGSELLRASRLDIELPYPAFAAEQKELRLGWGYPAWRE